MTTHGSATTREEEPHANQTTRTATIIDKFSQTPSDADPSRKKIEALAEIICGAGDQSAAALLVLMGTLEHSTHPKVLAHTAKHFAFTRCGELNFNGMVDAQIAMLEGELLPDNTLLS